MGSGNFLIGEGLSLQGFEQYVQPLLEKKGCYVKDKLAINQDNLSTKKILVSISGKGDLDKTIDYLLVKTGKILEKELDKKGVAGRTAYSHQISQYTYPEKMQGKKGHVCKGKYKVLGVYQDEGTASKLFPALAQNYLLDGLETKADEVAEKFKELSNTKIGDL